MLINVFLNTSRTGPEPFRRAEARRSIKSFALPTKFEGMMSDDQVPDHLVSEDMVDRYLALTPPNITVIPEFQTVINEIEKAYVRGLYFSTAASACVAIERMLNVARIELHHHHPKIKELWGKGASNSWSPNIDALLSAGDTWMSPSRRSSLRFMKMSGTRTCIRLPLATWKRTRFGLPMPLTS